MSDPDRRGRPAAPDETLAGERVFLVALPPLAGSTAAPTTPVAEP